MNYIVYAIGLAQDLIDPYTNCYVGVTNKLDRRWKSHCKSNYTIGKFIRDNNLTYECNVKIIFHGSEEECFAKESELRPYPMIGLNEAAGGHGGYTSYTDERNKKISKELTGRKVDWMDKIVSNRGTYEGSNNPAAKRWLLIDPTGNEHKIHGQLAKFCSENNILMSALTYYKGCPVPFIKEKQYGGYRAKNYMSKILREKTSGWTLKQL